jgi:hypothetical protein
MGRTEVIMGSDHLLVHCHFCLAKTLEQCLIDITSFGLSKLLYSRSVLFSRTYSFWFCFHRSFGSYNLRHQISDTRQLSFIPFCICSIIVAFPSTLKNLPFFVGCSYAITLPVSAINCSSRKVDGNFMYGVIYRFIVILQAWKRGGLAF